MKPETSLCEQEPIHTPGLIQPVGFLLVVQKEDLKIIEEAGSTPFDEIKIGKSLFELWFSCASYIATYMDNVGEYRHFSVAFNKEMYDIRIHQSGIYIVVEGMGYTNRYENAKDVLAQKAVSLFEKHEDNSELFSEICTLIKNVSGYDRVMLYKFKDDFHGEVIAESVKSDILNSFLYHRFPASDIPAQARALYVKNPVRFITDTHAQNIPVLLPTGTLDMSMCAFRAVSPIHIEYLKNMGIQASMSISIIIEDKLWGLIACHSKKPKIMELSAMPYYEMIGRLLAREVYLREQYEFHAEYSRLQREVDTLCHQAIIQIEQDGFVEALETIMKQIAIAYQCDGLAFCIDGHEPLVTGIIDKQSADELNKKISTHFFVSDELSLTFPEYKESKMAGILYIKLPTIPKLTAIFAAKEEVETIVWAGNPAKDFTSGNLSPRESFEAWKQVVKGKSKPWSKAKVELAKDSMERVTEAIMQGQIKHKLAEREKILTQQAKLATMGEMIHNIAHQWKQPLSVLFMSMPELDDAYKQNDEERFTSAISTCTKLLNQMTQTISDFKNFLSPSREKESFVLFECVDGVLEFVKADMKYAGIKIFVSCDEALKLYGFKNELKHVLLNLISNAKDILIEKQTKNPLIKIEAMSDGGKVVIKISDNGGGIKEGAMEHIFDRYFTTKTETGGSGIGLHMSKMIVESIFGGKIYAANQEDGACFTILI